MAGKADIEAGRAFLRLALKDDMTKALQKSLANVGTKLKATGTAITGIGRQFAAVGGAALLPFGLALRTFAAFDDEMRVVASVSGAVGDEFDSLTDKAKKLGASTSFTATEVALLMSELGRAGFAPKQIEEMTGAVLNLSRATKTDAAVSAGIMSAAIRQFSLDASDATRVADAFTATANGTFNTVEMLGDAMAKAGPVVADLGMSFEESLAAFGTLGNLGIQGEEAGSALKRIALSAAGDADKLQRIFGVAFKDSAGDALPLIDVLEQVNIATKDLGSADRAKKLKDAFGLRGITGAGAIGRGAGSTKELLESIKAAGGIAEDTAAKMDAGLGGSFRILKSAVEGVAIAIGEVLSPVITPLVRQATKIIQSSIEWVKANRAIVVGFVAAAAATFSFGAGLLGIGAAISFAGFAVSGLAAGLGIIGALISAIASPIGMATAGIIAATIAWLRFTESGATAANAFWVVVDRIRDVLSVVGDALASGDLAAAGSIAFLGLQIAAMEGLAALRTLVGDTVTSIAGKILSGDISGAWSETVKHMTATWAAFNEGVAGMFTNMAASVVETWRKVTSFISRQILELASMPGFNTLFEFVSGVDIRAEIARGQQMGIEDPLGNAQQIATDQIDQQANDILAKLDEINAAARAVTDSAGKDAADATSSGIDALFAELEKKRAEFDSSRKAAADKAAASASAKGGGIVIDGGGGLGGGGGGGGSSSFVTLSAAAAVAAGFQGRSPQDKLTDEMKATKKVLEDMKKDTAALALAAGAIALGLTYGA